mmetsp:Transcript_29524/g.35942  ORF Transcript_29524/g.35942 Transcript_29524/m.35942 type:complete len:265 (-) Transcript_29524:300-1094(-)
MCCRLKNVIFVSFSLLHRNDAFVNFAQLRQSQSPLYTFQQKKISYSSLRSTTKNSGISDDVTFADSSLDRRDLFRKVSLICLLRSAMNPSKAAATEYQSLDSSLITPTVFNGDYSDPFHPLCKRRIDVSSDMKTFQYSGTAVGPKDGPVRRGCTEQEQLKYGSRIGAFDGILSSNRISAGDGIHEGVWEPATKGSKRKNANVDGIRWNDGNKWVKLSSSDTVNVSKDFDTPEKIVGEVFLVSYTGFSLLAGAKELVKRLQDKAT